MKLAQRHGEYGPNGPNVAPPAFDDHLIDDEETVANLPQYLLNVGLRLVRQRLVVPFGD